VSPSETTRRGVLAACATAVAAGCVGSPPAVDRDATDVWPMHRADPGGTNHVPDSPGPARSPTELWRVETSASFQPPSPVAAGDRLYFGSFDRFYALDAATGGEHWELGRNGGYWTYAALADAPAYGDVMPVVATRNGYEGVAPSGGVDVFGFQRNFETRWRRTTGDAGGPLRTALTPIPPVVADGTLFAATDGDPAGVVAFDAATGQTEWQTAVPRASAARVAVRDGRVFVPAYADGLFALDAATGARRWEASLTDPAVAPPTATADAVFTHDREAVYAFDPASGDELWRSGLADSLVDTRTPLAAGGGRVFAVGDPADGDGSRVLALDAATGEVDWQTAGGTDEVPPVLAADTLYVPENGGLRALDPATGEQRWQHGDDHVRALAVAGKRAYAATARGALYALEGQR
jgi:serine/threonine-protein kinase